MKKENPYIEHLGNKTSIIIQKYHDEIKTNKPDYTIQEEYVINTFNSLGEIETVYEQLEQSPYFLSNFRSTKSLKKKQINRFHHIIYHIESYLFRTTGILDRMMIHLNDVFGLKLSPQQCKPYNLLVDKNGKLGKHSKYISSKNPSLFQSLITLLKLVNQIRDVRNEVSHQNRYYSKTLKNVEMLYIVKDAKIEGFSDSDLQFFTKKETDIAVALYKKWMLNMNKEIRILLDQTYILLKKNWKEKYKEFYI